MNNVNSMNSMNSIDPRVMKELLQLQLLGKISLLSGDTSTSSTDDSSDFSALLDTLMGQATGTGNTNQDTLASMTGKAGAGSIPSSLSALNKTYSPLQSVNNVTSASPYEGLIQEASRKYGVDSSLVKAVIQQESAFNHQAVSPAGAKGLMQLMDGTGSGLGVTNPFDPKQNVDAGTRFLGHLIKKYNGNESVALAAYNAGPGRVDRLGIKTDQELAAKLHLLPKETQAYVSKIMGNRQKFSL